MVLLDIDRERIEGLRARTLSCLIDAVGRDSSVAIIDAPNQRNVGDSLIWAGEVAYLRQLGAKVRYISDLWSFDAATLRESMPEGVVLLHGGGNFGDLWPGHQLLRERVLRELPDYRVIQLPQSVHFQDERNIESAAAALAAHGNCHLLIRDTQSLARAQEYFAGATIDFCPDMAYGWEPPIIGRKSDEGRMLVLARADHEAASGLSGVPTDWVRGYTSRRTDWVDWNGTSLERAEWESMRRLSAGYGLYVRGRRKYLPKLPGYLPNAGAGRVLDRINRINIQAAARLFADADVIATDRLHAHVLASLLGRTHVVLDNSYGKVSTIYQDYSGDFSSAHYATSVSEAASILSAFGAS